MNEGQPNSRWNIKVAWDDPKGRIISQAVSCSLEGRPINLRGLLHCDDRRLP